VREAADERQAIAALQADGYMPIRVGPAGAPSFWRLRRGARPTKLSAKDIGLFTSELATLLESGLPLDKSLQVLIDLTADHPRVSKLIGKVLERVKSGSTLADALEKQSGVFSKFYLNMIRAGEAGGGLGDVLARLAGLPGALARIEGHRQHRADLSGDFAGDVAGVAVRDVDLRRAAVFRNVRKRRQGAAGVDADRHRAGRRAATVWLDAGAGRRAGRRLSEPATGRSGDETGLGRPVVATAAGRHHRAEPADRQPQPNAGTLLGNGVSILSALAIVRETVDNLVLAAAIHDAEEQLRQGRNMSDALLDKGLFPKLALQMIKMGEETGRLEEMLLRVAAIYDKQVRIAIQRMLALLEPALIITLGLMIGGIIVSILLAILSVNDLAF